MKAPAPSLRRRITSAFLATTAFTCLLFGSFAFAFAYSVEDQLFADLVTEEVTRQQAHWRASRTLAEPRLDYVTIYGDAADFPEDLRRRYGAGRRTEVAGTEGRHYHVRRFALPGGGSAFAVAEVSDHLVVRPLRSELAVLLLVSSLAVLLLAGLGAYLLARRATAPLTQLADSVAGARGDPVPTIAMPTDPPREIAVLAAALEQAFDRVRAFVAREAQFTRDASHELRTPLAVIRGAAELIALQPQLDPAVERPLRRVQAAAHDMERSIELLLALAREEHDRSPRTLCRLLPLVEQAILAAGDRFDGDAGPVEVHVAPSQAVEAAPAALALIIGNLVANAFQHARGGAIVIVGDREQLTIADGGPGLPDGVVERMFEPFAKGEASEGHGLGLSIVKRLCDREGIALSVSSEPSCGTTFVLRFAAPAEQAAP